jgi:hypothetical protein
MACLIMKLTTLGALTSAAFALPAGPPRAGLNSGANQRAAALVAEGDQRPTNTAIPQRLG